MAVVRNHSPPHVMSVREKQEKQLGPGTEFVGAVKAVMSSWSLPALIVTRYLFSFLSDLSRNSEDTQMDPYNLAICFGPTLCPIPQDRDLVSHTNLVNDLIKNCIIFSEEIFAGAAELEGAALYEPVK